MNTLKKIDGFRAFSIAGFAMAVIMAYIVIATVQGAVASRQFDHATNIMAYYTLFVVILSMATVYRYIEFPYRIPSDGALLGFFIGTCISALKFVYEMF